MVELLKSNRYRADVCFTSNAEVKSIKVFYGDMPNITGVLKNLFKRARYRIDNIKIEKIEENTPQ